MEAAALEAGASCRAVVVTHLYGRMADMEPPGAAAGRCGLAVVEDCAQAHGARLDGRAAGAWGDAGCYSLYPTKNLGALWDAGAVVTGDGELARRVAALRQYGWDRQFEFRLPGGRNSRLDPLQAAVLAAKLPYLSEWNRRRRDIAARYVAAFAPAIAFQRGAGDADVVHHYVVRVPGRGAVRKQLEASGIGTGIHYPVPDNQQPALQGAPFAAAALPETGRAAAEVLSLPCFPELTAAEVEAVIEAVLAAVQQAPSC